MDIIPKRLKNLYLAIFLIFAVSNLTSGEKIKTCKTPACETTASAIMKYMNTSVKPCDDFYEFVCGNIENEVIIREGYSRNTSFSMIYDEVQQQLKTSFESKFTAEKDPESFLKLKSYYDVCMNDELREKNSEAEFLGILKEVGDWALITNKSSTYSDFDWMDTTYKFNDRGFISGPFFDFGISADIVDNSKRVIYLSNPSFGLNQEFLTQVTETKIRTAYLKFMVDVLVILGADKDRAVEEMTEVLMLKVKLAKICLTIAEQRNISNLYNPMTVDQLQQKYPYIPWLDYMNNIFYPHQTVRLTDTIILTGPKYFENLNEILASTSKRVQANFVYWRSVLQVASTLSDRVKKASEQLSIAMTGSVMKLPKWVQCVSSTSSRFSLATGALYVRNYFDHSKKESVLKIINDLNSTFRKILEEIDWMDKDTKKAALEKLDNMAPLIAYPNELLDDDKLNGFYKNLDVDAMSLLKTELQINRFASDRTVRSLYEPVNRFDWTGLFGAASTVNAFYDPTVNAIEFPSGILQHPFFNADNPRYTNYAGVGFVVGHEMTHGFDDTGRQFDKVGHFLDWWQSETKKEFLEKARCIIQQYSNYTVKEVNMKLNGLISQGENIADNGGIKVSYMAYDKWQKVNPAEPRLPGLESYTPKQLFWISYAHVWCTKHRPGSLKVSILTDTHSIAPYRVIGPLSNRPEFSKDFNCPMGSPMNPEKKCQVW